MNVVFIIPTGIGCEIGGHAGDATPAAKLVASVCDTLIIHPNVVNASDINEMTENMLYVEGSMLDRFLDGRIEGLRRVKSNKILVVVSPPIVNETINAVSAARATIGTEIEIVELKIPLIMTGYMEGGIAGGSVEGWKELIEQIKEYDFDALGIVTYIDTSLEVEENYFKNGGVNPWGGVEAKASRLISESINKPVAHAPFIEKELRRYGDIVDSRMGAEIVSNCFLHCILKGLHKAPQVGTDLKVDDIDFLVSPWGCYGRPHEACDKAKIPIIYVEENKTIYDEQPQDTSGIYAKNYLEVVGIISAKKIGITVSSVRRPLEQTKVIKGINHEN